MAEGLKIDKLTKQVVINYEAKSQIFLSNFKTTFTNNVEVRDFIVISKIGSMR